ncbi:MAG: PEP-CTERM sorting domain-containing protein [Burkholderiales bacterium]
MARTLATLLLMTTAGIASAGLVTQTLGNPSPGFNDGDVPAVFPDLVNAQSGQPSPFDGGLGSDLFENGLATWTFNYGAIASPLVSASLRIGIADHDSAALGSQLSGFTADGGDFTSALDALFESGGGAGDSQYKIYTLDVSSILANLVDGSATISLALKGPGLLTDIFNNNAEVSSDFNGFFLIFSKLDIVTQDQTPTVPEPGTLALFGISALALAGAARRLKHL